MDTMSNAVRVATRNEIAVEDTWDLSSLYKDIQGWERDLKKLEQFQKQNEPFRGTMKQSAQRVAEFLKFDLQVIELLNALDIRPTQNHRRPSQR